MLELWGASLLSVPLAAIVTVASSHVHPDYHPPASNQNLEVHLPITLGNETLTTQSDEASGAQAFWQRLAMTMGPPGLVLGLFSMAFHLRERRRFREQLNRVSKDIAAAGESERIRIARELHDGVCQWLVVSKHSFESAFDSARTADPNSMQHLRRGLGNLEECIREIRRISRDLKPVRPADRSFVEALAKLMHEVAESAPVDLQVDGSDAGQGEQHAPHARLESGGQPGKH
jgi:signal transduction histidine kinase